MSYKEYDNLFHELYELSKNDMVGMNAGRTTQERYFGYLCWQAATKASEAKLASQDTEIARLRELLNRVIDNDYSANQLRNALVLGEHK